MKFFRENVKAAKTFTLINGACQRASFSLNNSAFHTKAPDLERNFAENFQDGFVENMLSSVGACFYLAKEIQADRELMHMIPGMVVSTFFQSVALDLLTTNGVSPTFAILAATALTSLTVSACEKMVDGVEAVQNYLNQP